MFYLFKCFINYFICAWGMGRPERVPCVAVADRRPDPGRDLPARPQRNHQMVHSATHTTRHDTHDTRYDTHATHHDTRLIVVR